MNTRTVFAVALSLFALAGASATMAADEVIRARSFDTADLRSVQLKVGVGDIRIESGTTDTIEARVTIRAKRTTGIFSSLPDVEKLDIAAKTRGDRLSLEIDAKNIEETWVLRLPKKILSSVEVALGVGDINVNTPAKFISVDLGVGDADIETPQGAVTLQVGTGDGKIRTPISNAGSIDGKTGVGSASLKGLEGTVSSSTVGGSVRGQGRGQQPIEARIGVGDLSIELTK